MVTKSQHEMEQPAKVYQLNAVEVKVDSMNAKLDTLLTQTSGLVTVPQMEASIKDAVDKLHLEYKPLKRNLNRFVWLLVSGIITVITQAVVIYVVATGK